MSFAGIERFLFAPVDPRSARVLRLILVAACIAVFWPTSREPLGWILRAPAAEALWSTVFRAPAWWAASVAALLAFAAGLGGRRTGWLAVALLLPLVAVRGFQSRQVLWFALLSVSLLYRAGPTGPAGPIWPLRLVQLQLSTLYAVNAWAKTSVPYLRGDVLVGLSQTMPNFLVNLSDGSLHLGALAIPVWVCAVGTVAIEAALAVGFWIPKLRIATAVLGVGFHLSLQWVVEIGWLDWASLALYPAFLLSFQRDRMDDPSFPGATR